jgi:hypothetical protein
MRIGLELAAFSVTYTSILLANMSVETILIPARAPPRARATLHHILQTMLRLNLERMVIERTIEVIAGARQMMCVARLLFMEARIIREPFVGGGRTDVSIQAVAVLVEGDKAWRNGSGEVRRDILTVSTGRRGGGRGCLGIRNGVVRNMDEVAFATPTAEALIISVVLAFARSSHDLPSGSICKAWSSSFQALAESCRR